MHLEGTKEHFLEGMGVPEKSDFKPDEFQEAAISAVVNSEDTLVVAPTGAGKTYIAFESIAAELSMRKRCVYTTPLKALSNSKYNELKNRFEPEHKVGLLTGDRKIDTGGDVVVATTEIYRNELYRGDSNYSLVVLDEVHYIADQQRGPVWEEAILFTPKDTTLLMLSASISNYQEIAEWLESVRGRPCRIITVPKRPVELRFGFLHPEYGPLPLYDSRGGLFKPVLDYYGNTRLDDSGMKFKKRPGYPRGHGGRNRNRRR